uniref:Putative secreted protein n=1 Tax=Ixodes ricinus TaxID=34613 RepID=A0A147BCI1_IXORI
MKSFCLRAFMAFLLVSFQVRRTCGNFAHPCSSFPAHCLGHPGRGSTWRVCRRMPGTARPQSCRQSGQTELETFVRCLRETLRTARCCLPSRTLSPSLLNSAGKCIHRW